MRWKRVGRAIIGAVAAWSAFSTAAQAEVTHVFEGFNADNEQGQIEARFTLTVDDFITASASFSPAALTECFFRSERAFGCNQVSFNPSSPSSVHPTGFLDFINVISGQSFNRWLFAPGVLNTPGDHPSLRFAGHNAFLRVIASDDPGGVPEPASWALLISGFGVAGAALRRRQVSAGQSCHAFQMG